MKGSKLFLKIRKDLKCYKSKLECSNDSKHENINSIDRIMSKYNCDNFNEIMNLSIDEVDDEIDEEKLEDFRDRIDHYFNLYAPDDEFKDFIMAISLYLTFIAKRPLHPPGIEFSDGNRVYKIHDKYYCTGKSVLIQDKLSLCKYCVCKPK